MAEQPPDSPPLYPDDELKTLITVTDYSSASTSSTPAFSAPVFSVHDSGNEISESTIPGPKGHSLEEIFQCKWGGPNGLSCDEPIHGHNISSHLRQVHEIHGHHNLLVMCRWTGCNKQLRKDNLSRHVEEIHLGITYSCNCGKTFRRKSSLSAHRGVCTGQQ
ncbi:hypothetical protein BD769DRAFT_1044549 [Suillus cothurnatus]|nr:hypothetical protein BD769DRAFT_1044549 [Suillus cothurnatus]